MRFRSRDSRSAPAIRSSCRSRTSSPIRSLNRSTWEGFSTAVIDQRMRPGTCSSHVESVTKSADDANELPTAGVWTSCGLWKPRMSDPAQDWSLPGLAQGRTQQQHSLLYVCSGWGVRWRSANQSAPTPSSRWRILCRASVPRNPRSPIGRPPPSSPSSPRRCRHPDDGTRLHRAGHRLAHVARRARGRGLPASKRRVRHALARAKRARRALSSSCRVASVAQTLRARPAC
jgi:hypothetical protein